MLDSTAKFLQASIIISSISAFYFVISIKWAYFRCSMIYLKSLNFYPHVRSNISETLSRVISKGSLFLSFNYAKKYKEATAQTVTFPRKLWKLVFGCTTFRIYSSKSLISFSLRRKSFIQYRTTKSHILTLICFA